MLSDLKTVPVMVSIKFIRKREARVPLSAVDSVDWF